jgi:hypothetical protein
MAWPEPMALLLARPDSRAAQALRWGLCGLRAGLQAALAEVPPDDGSEQLRALLAELDPLLLAEGHVGANLMLAGAGDAQATHLPRLLPLARAVVEDGRFQAELRRQPLREDGDDVIWNDVQRLLLRVPAYLADEWRRRARQLAEQAGARVDVSAAATLPLGRDETIYPGLAGAVQATGLWSAASAAPDPRVGPADGEDLGVLAGAVTTCLWLIDNDGGLYHCLKGVFRFGIPPLTGEQRERYMAELLRLWERVRATAREGGTPDRQQLRDALRTVVDLDEALHSLVYQPLAAPDSWWGKLMGQSRDVLLRLRERAVAAGCPAQVQVLGGSFADINRLAPDSLQVDFGVPGEVSTCLRVWARIDGEELKGRVLYRSPQEEP